MHDNECVIYNELYQEYRQLITRDFIVCYTCR